MKTFTSMLLLLALILALMVFGGHQALVPGPAEPPPPVFVSAPAPAVAGESASVLEREEVEGLPVPIVPGTRVTEARIVDPKAENAGTTTRRTAEVHRVRAPLPPGVRRVTGQLSATEERALADARHQLEHEVAAWITPEVATSWKPPAALITRMVHKSGVSPIVKEYGTVYEATLEADFTPQFRAEILAAYQREVVGHRLATLGGSLGFVLACLAAVAGYIHADEATRGYYTRWLRALAAAGVGASGVIIYQILT
jgi:hypothetical protein